MLTDDWIQQYQTLYTTGGLISLAGWSQVQLSGNDRVSFLQNMCTNDIRRLEPGRSCEAFCTDVKGKILAHVIVVAEVDRLTLLTVPMQAERIIQHLNRYIIREDVDLSDISNDFKWYLVIAPHGGAAARAGDSAVASSIILGHNCHLLREAKSATLADDSLLVIETTSPVWTALRCEAGLPVYGVDFDDSSLPQEVNRDAQAISFAKGCYLGQETVARIDALGHVNRKLVVLKYGGETVPQIGSKLNAGNQDVGTVSTASWSPRLNAPLAIAVVRRSSNDVGTKLQSQFGEAEVIAPPA